MSQEEAKSFEDELRGRQERSKDAGNLLDIKAIDKFLFDGKDATDKDIDYLVANLPPNHAGNGGAPDAGSGPANQSTPSTPNTPSTPSTPSTPNTPSTPSTPPNPSPKSVDWSKMTPWQAVNYARDHQSEMTEADWESLRRAMKSYTQSEKGSVPAVAHSEIDRFIELGKKGKLTRADVNNIHSVMTRAPEQDTKVRTDGGTSDNGIVTASPNWKKMTSGELKDYLIAHQKEMTQWDKEDALKEIKSRLKVGRDAEFQFEKFRAGVMKGNATQLQGDQLMPYVK